MTQPTEIELLENINILLQAQFGGNCQMIDAGKFTKVRFNHAADSFNIQALFNKLNVKVLDQVTQNGLIVMILEKIDLDLFHESLAQTSYSAPTPRL